MSTPGNLTLSHGDLTAAIAIRGAELKSLRQAGTEFIWQADPQWWNFSAPMLFPIVGRLPDGRIAHGDGTLTIPPHGFARDLPFTVREAAPSQVTLRLAADAQTRAIYPFAFELTVSFTLGDAGLEQRVAVCNQDIVPMPASFGFHPGFRWPVRGARRDGHTVRFDSVQTGAPLRHDKAGWLIGPSTFDSGVKLRHAFTLDDSLFADGAMVFNPVQGQGLQYADAEGPLMELRWTGCRQLGIWTLPGAPFICFEPWHGHANPAGYSGSLMDKPGSFQLLPGEARAFSMTLLPKLS